MIETKQEILNMFLPVLQATNAGKNVEKLLYSEQSKNVTIIARSEWGDYLNTFTVNADGYNAAGILQRILAKLTE